MCAHKYNNKYKEDDELVYVMLYVATGEDLQCPAVPGVCLKIWAEVSQMGKHLQNPPDNIYAQFGDKLQRKREIGIHDSQKNNNHHCKMTVLGLRWVEAIQREGGGGWK